MKRNFGKKLTIGYQNRFRADSRYLKSFCDAGGLGDIYFAKAHALRRRAVPTWGVFLDAEAQGGGPLIDIGTHALDLTLWMMNNYEPEFAVGKDRKSTPTASSATERTARTRGGRGTRNNSRLRIRLLAISTSRTELRFFWRQAGR